MFAGYAQGSVQRRAGGVDDRAVVREQILAGYVLAEGDVAEVAKARVRGGLLVHAGDRLDLRVIGGDAGANESPRGGKALEHVDLEMSGGLLQQVPGGVEAGGTGADDSYADWGLVGHQRDVWWVGLQRCGAEDGRGPTRTGDPLGVNEVL